jgi:hypothetical protein
MSSTLPQIATGGPLLDFSGRVVGIIGGSLTPGMSSRRDPLNLRAGIPVIYGASGSTIDGISLQMKSPSRTLHDLLDTGVLTLPLAENTVFYFGAITDKVAPDSSYTAKGKFSRKDPAVTVYTTWAKKGKTDKGVVSLKVYDANNRLRAKMEPQTLRLPDERLLKYQCGFSPAGLEPGSYRIDLLWNDLPIWRAFITITD